MGAQSLAQVEAEALRGDLSLADSSLAEAMSRRSARNHNSLELERRDIVFYNIAPDRVRMEITLRNKGAEASQQTQARVAAAPLGAFVPWQPLLTLPVPALLPGEAVTLRTDAQPSRPGQPRIPRRIRPRRPRTGAGAEEPEERGESACVRFERVVWEALMRLAARQRTAAAAEQLPILPADWNDARERRAVAWAGNLNVFVRRRAVERHAAMGLHVSPGCVNMADFVVGSRPDAYAFEIAGEALNWKVELRTDCEIFEPTEQGRIPFGQWVEFSGMQVVYLTMEPPRSCTAGDLEVHVRQRSSGREAVVEFGFDPEAAGAGCTTLR